MTAEAVAARVRELRSDVARHKAAIRKHRVQLGLRASELRAAEAELARIGIRLMPYEPSRNCKAG